MKMPMRMTNLVVLLFQMLLCNSFSADPALPLRHGEKRAVSVFKYCSHWHLPDLACRSLNNSLFERPAASTSSHGTLFVPVKNHRCESITETIALRVDWINRTLPLLLRFSSDGASITRSVVRFCVAHRCPDRAMTVRAISDALSQREMVKQQVVTESAGHHQQEQEGGAEMDEAAPDTAVIVVVALGRCALSESSPAIPLVLAGLEAQTERLQTVYFLLAPRGAVSAHAAKAARAVTGSGAVGRVAFLAADHPAASPDHRRHKTSNASSAIIATATATATATAAAAEMRNPSVAHVRLLAAALERELARETDYDADSETADNAEIAENAKKMGTPAGAHVCVDGDDANNHRERECDGSGRSRSEAAQQQQQQRRRRRQSISRQRLVDTVVLLDLAEDDDEHCSSSGRGRRLPPTLVAELLAGRRRHPNAAVGFLASANADGGSGGGGSGGGDRVDEERGQGKEAEEEEAAAARAIEALGDTPTSALSAAEGMAVPLAAVEPGALLNFLYGTAIEQGSGSGKGGTVVEAHRVNSVGEVLSLAVGLRGGGLSSIVLGGCGLPADQSGLPSLRPRS